MYATFQAKIYRLSVFWDDNAVFLYIKKEVGAGCYQPRISDFETSKSKKVFANIGYMNVKSKFLTRQIDFLTFGVGRNWEMPVMSPTISRLYLLTCLNRCSMSGIT